MDLPRLGSGQRLCADQSGRSGLSAWQSPGACTPASDSDTARIARCDCCGGWWWMDVDGSGRYRVACPVCRDQQQPLRSGRPVGKPGMLRRNEEVSMADPQVQLTPEQAKSAAPRQVPSVVRAVHYKSYGTPGGEYTSECRAAVITEVLDPGNPLSAVRLCIFNPSGIFLTPNPIAYGNEPGQWHWPEPTPFPGV